MVGGARRALVGVLVVVLAACSPAKPGGGGGSAPPTPTAWRLTLDRVGPDGRVDLPTALAAFSLAVGPVPGAAAPAGRTEAIPSGTVAVLWIFAHWSELSAEQRTAVLTDLGAAAVTAPADYLIKAPSTPAPPADPNLACLTADSAGAGPYRAQLAGIESELSAHLGRPLTIAGNTFVTVNTKDLEQPSMMYAYGCVGAKAAQSGKVSGCTIHVNPSTAGGHFTDAELHSFLIHEVMHCFLFDRFGMAYHNMPAWYVEGAPTWGMSVLGTSSFKLGSFWQRYLDTPEQPLSARTYEGLGFFVHLAETGTDPWKVIDAIGAAMVGAGAGATAAGWKAAGVSPGFLDSWGGGPALPQGRLGNGGTVPVTSPAFATAVRHLDVDASVVLVTPGAGTSGRITLGGGTDARFAGGPYCTIAGCSCPPDSPGAGTRFEKMTSGVQYLGLTGGTQAGSVMLAGLSLPDFCKKPSRPCVVGQWNSVGFSVQVGQISEQGGAGVKLHIDPQGNLTVAFDGMAPVTFTSSSSAGQISGQFTYGGTMTGVLTLPAGGATSGTWQQAKAPDFSRITAHVRVTKPFAVDLGAINLAQLAGSFAGAGSTVDGKPIVGGGWQCTGDTLTTTPPANSSVSGTWTLARTGPG